MGSILPRAVGAVAVLVAATCARLPAAEGPPAETRSLPADRLVPQWHLGDRWIVETTTRPLQVRSDPALVATSRAIQWQFSVQRYEKSLSDDCYRLEVRCLESKQPRPVTVLWIDRQTLALRQLQTQLPTPDGFRTITQSYEFTAGQPSPVLGPLTALPIDLPLFRAGQAKGMETFTYETHSGPRGTKAVGDVGFAYHVKQQIAPADADEAKTLVGESLAKGLQQKPLVEVRIVGPQRRVRQLWQPGLPWPVYCENGSTVCRLVKVLPADGKKEPPREATE